MSTQDLIQLIALLLAVQVGLMGVVAGFIVPIYMGRERAMRRDLKRISEITERHKLVVYVITEALLEVAAIDETHAGLVQRLIIRTGVNGELPNFASHLGDSHARLVKRIQELMLLRPGDERRRSAVLQLSQVLGDYQSLELLRAVATLADGDQELVKGLRVLERRLGALPMNP